MRSIVWIAMLVAGCCPADVEDDDHYVSANLTSPTAEETELLDRCSLEDDCEAICTRVLQSVEGYDETFEAYTCDVTRTPTGARIHVRYTIGPVAVC